MLVARDGTEFELKAQGLAGKPEQGMTDIFHSGIEYDKRTKGLYNETQ